MKSLLTFVSVMALAAITGSVSLAQGTVDGRPKPDAPAAPLTTPEALPPKALGQTGKAAPGPAGASSERNAPALEYTLALIFVFGVLAILCAPSRKGV